MNRRIFQYLMTARRTAPGFLWLIDPDKIDLRHPDPRWEMAAELGVTAVLVGTSQRGNDHYTQTTQTLREHIGLPMILFPGSAAQVSPHVDAVLFLSLLSGRNPDFLVGEQVKGTPRIREHGIEPIPTGYLLIDTGTQTSVTRESRTRPLPESDTAAIRHHALCAQYMGKVMVYLEAGSGAKRPVSPTVIQNVRAEIEILLTAGGGLKTPENCADAIRAGADFVVVGTALEDDSSAELLRAMTTAVTSAGEKVSDP